MHRTTIDLNDDLYRAARKFAIDREKTLKELIQEALQQYLFRAGMGARARTTDRMPGVYRATVKGTLSRGDLYEDYLAHKVHFKKRG